MPKHQLLDFDVIRTFEAYRWRASRRAIMYPLFGRSAPTLMKDQQAALDSVRAAWRHRVVELSEAGWIGLKDWTANTYAMNCPPFGVQTLTKSRRCGRPQVCPFCFARQRVLYSFRRMEVILFGKSGPYMQGQQLWEQARGKTLTKGSPLLPCIRPDLKVVWFRRVIRDKVRHLPFDLSHIQEQVRITRKWVNKNRTSEFKAFGAEYGCTQFNLYPVPRKEQLVVVRSGVMLVPKAMPDSRVQDFIDKVPDGGWDRVPDKAEAGLCPPTKAGLCEAFTKSVRYPLHMMRGLPTWTAATLNALHKFRGISWYGPHLDSKVTFKKSDFDTEEDVEEDDDE